MTTLYRGWVPTVTGRLSFSHFADCHLSRSKSFGRTDSKKLYLVVWQKRTTWDVMLPAWGLFEDALELTGSPHFICLAETVDIGADEQGALVGHVCVIAERTRWDSIVKPALEAAADSLEHYDATSAPIASHFAQTLKDVSVTCMQNSAFHVAFYLKRNGVIDITVDEGLARAAESPAFPTGHARHTVAGQAFSFLRDVGHKHQHHSATSDTIVDIHEIIERDDKKWRLKTLYSIYRRIITYKRQDDIQVQIDSVGLLAYAKAFKNVWLEDRPEDKDELPKFYDDAMKESIQASELRMRYKTQRAADRWSIFRTITIFLFGFVLSFGSFIRVSQSTDAIKVAPSPVLVWTATTILQYPLYCFGILFAACFVIWAIYARLFRIEQKRWFRYAQAMLQPFRPVTVLFFTTVLAIAIAAIAYLIA